MEKNNCMDWIGTAMVTTGLVLINQWRRRSVVWIHWSRQEYSDGHLCRLPTYMSDLSLRIKTSHQPQVECRYDNPRHYPTRTMRVAWHQHRRYPRGLFQVDAFLRKLVKILSGTGNVADDDDSHKPDDDAQLAAALALSRGGQYQGDDNLEAQVLAARLPSKSHGSPSCCCPHSHVPRRRPCPM